MYGSKHRTTDGLYETRKDASGYSSTKREWNSQNDDSSNHRKYIRTESSSNNRTTVPSSSSSQQQRQNGDKDRKTVKDSKKPLRVFGDWSEFKSSTGKTYFYNCKTEISQWEKPKGWPTDEPTSRSSSFSTDRIKKESTNVSISPPVRSRYKMEEFKEKILPNGDIHSHKSNQESLQSNEISNNRLPSPDDESSRMSFSSTSSSKESSAVINPDRNGSELAITIFDNETKSSNNRSSSIDNDSSTSLISKAERDQEMQKYYRADLIQHLTDWRSTQLEKQCLKLFDDYYGYSAKMSTALIELKAFKSNFRVLEIKRNILTQRLLRCRQHLKERDDDKLL
jgi:hypothetical protein